MGDNRGLKLGLGLGLGAVAALGLGALGAAAAYAIAQGKQQQRQHQEGHQTERHGHGHSHGHNHGQAGGRSAAAAASGDHAREHGHAHARNMSFADVEAWAAKLDAPERDAYQQPDRVITEVIAPLIDAAMRTSAPSGADSGASAGPTAGSRRPVIVDFGAGSGYFTFRLSRAFPAATIVAVDAQPAMLQYIQRQAASAASGSTSNVLTAAAPPEGASASGAVLGVAHLGLQADVALLVNVYHHLEDRLAFLRKVATTSELATDGSLVLIEFRTGQLPIEAPPTWMRLERSVVIAEAEAAGFELHDAPNFLEHHYMLVFKRRAPEAVDAQ